MKKYFDCEQCGNHGSISYKEQEMRFSMDPAFCPFCGADIFEPDEEDDDD